MSDHPRPHINSKFDSPEEARNHFLGLPTSAPSHHDAPTQHATYKAEILLAWARIHYPGSRPYNPTNDGDLVSAQALQERWRSQIARLEDTGLRRWGVGGAEHGEVFVRVNEHGQKEWILPAVPVAVTWSTGKKNLDRQGWVVRYTPSQGPHDIIEHIACPAYVLQPHAMDQPHVGRELVFVKEWKAGDRSELRWPYGLTVKSNGATDQWQYQVYPVGLHNLTETTPPPSTTSIWTCQIGSRHTVEKYIFDLELTHKIVELERQQAHVPLARAGAA
ncbi:hypothetical protein NBRC10513_004043 [Rhodotorula toruloides]